MRQTPACAHALTQGAMQQAYARQAGRHPKPRAVSLSADTMITIQVERYRDEPPAQPLVALFDDAGGSLGRGDTNTLVLPDPDKRISRVQAKVQWRDGAYWLDNVGAALPMGVGGRIVGPGEKVQLAHADLLTLGAYVLRVALTLPEADEERTVMMTAPPGAGVAGVADRAALPLSPPLPPPSPADPLGLLGSPAAASDPFADLLAPAPASAQPAAGAPLIPDDFDPFAPETPGTAARPAAPPIAPLQTSLPPSGATGTDASFWGATPAAQGPASSARPAGLDLGPGVGSPSIDDLFGLGGGSASGGALFGPGHPLGEPAAQPNLAQSLDPLAAFAAGAAPAPAARPAQRDDAPVLNTPFEAPAMRRLDDAPVLAPVPAPVRETPAVQPVPEAGTVFLSWEHAGERGDLGAVQRVDVQPAEPAVPSPALSEAQPPLQQQASPAPAPAPAAPAAQDQARAPGDAASPEALLQALLQGAGVPDLQRPPPLTPEFMHALGLLLRAATDGTLQLLLARALTKREVHAEATMIAARENNPLKFSPTVEVALQHLLSPQGRGFMTPLRAMQDAYDDLRSHQFGVMAGMQAALAGVLARFNPEELQNRLTQKTVIEALIPAQRKARLWDLFTEHYGAIQKEAQDDFDTLFGKAFLKAYEAQIAKLRAKEGGQ